MIDRMAFQYYAASKVRPVSKADDESKSYFEITHAESTKSIENAMKVSKVDNE